MTSTRSDLSVERSRTSLVGDSSSEQGARLRLAFLTEVSTLLGRSLDVNATLQQLADLLVPRLADWCTIDVLEEGELRLAAVAHRDPAQTSRVWQLEGRYGVADPHGPGKVVRTGEPELREEVTDEVLRFLAHDQGHFDLMRALDPVSAASVPLIARGRPLGAITLAQSHSRRRYAADDLPLLQDVAQRAAFSVDNAALYAERDRTARMLQYALLPPTLPEPVGLQVAARYDTADTVDIGGDFYDVIDTPQGWLMTVGDVCGKGVEAAAVSSLARHTVNAAAVQHADPAYVLRMLNEALMRDAPDESFCTATCAHLHTDSDQTQMTVASGGHPPPLVRRADGSIEQIEADGMAVGLFDHLRPEPTVVALHPGDVVLFYTDGLNEARRDGQLFGVEGAKAALRDTAGMDAEATLAHVQAAAEHWHTDQRDDMALLAVRVRPG